MVITKSEAMAESASLFFGILFALCEFTEVRRGASTTDIASPYDGEVVITTRKLPLIVTDSSGIVPSQLRDHLADVYLPEKLTYTRPKFTIRLAVALAATNLYDALTEAGYTSAARSFVSDVSKLYRYNDADVAMLLDRVRNAGNNIARAKTLADIEQESSADGDVLRKMDELKNTIRLIAYYVLTYNQDSGLSASCVGGYNFMLDDIVERITFVLKE